LKSPQVKSELPRADAHSFLPPSRR